MVKKSKLLISGSLNVQERTLDGQSAIIAKKPVLEVVSYFKGKKLNIYEKENKILEQRAKKPVWCKSECLKCDL